MNLNWPRRLPCRSDLTIVTAIMTVIAGFVPALMLAAALTSALSHPAAATHGGSGEAIQALAPVAGESAVTGIARPTKRPKSPVPSTAAAAVPVANPVPTSATPSASPSASAPAAPTSSPSASPSISPSTSPSSPAVDPAPPATGGDGTAGGNSTVSPTPSSP